MTNPQPVPIQTIDLVGLDARETGVLGEKLDHKAIKKPGLLICSMAAPAKSSTRNSVIPRLKREGPLMAAVSLPVRMIVGQAMRS